MSMQTPTRSLLSTRAMISDRSSNFPPMILPLPAYIKCELTSRLMEETYHVLDKDPDEARLLMSGVDSFRN